MTIDLNIQDLNQDYHFPLTAASKHSLNINNSISIDTTNFSNNSNTVNLFISNY